MDNQQLAALLFPDVTDDIAHLEAQYPPRQLAEEAKVTRIGPSPTGFIHLGNLYNAIIGERLARQSDGVFYLRIEDTDSKREVAGAVDTIISSLGFFGINFDEGATKNGDAGAYGPYRQRARKDIYHIVAKQLVTDGLAYPCFCTEDSLNSLRESQQAQKLDFGYYGPFAACRNLSLDEVKARIKDGQSYVLRFRSSGLAQNHITVQDGIRGELTLQQNFQDFVLLKSDGIPTYHFAHVVDDHLMRTTHVVRGEEWLSTLPIHLQLFDTLNWPRPVYCHTAQLMKQDGEVRRKLSKRLDPELALSYYRAEGYQSCVVWEYLMTILNSNFEQWRQQNPGAPLADFNFALDKMPTSGSLFDLVKMCDISKDLLCATPAAQVYDWLLAWAAEFDPDFAALLSRDRAYACAAIDVGRHGERPRKDLVSWSQARDFLSFYYDETFRIEDAFPANVQQADRRAIVEAYLAGYDAADDQDTWFNKIRQITEQLGFAVQPKLYRKNPELYKGSIVDVSNTLRVGLTGRLNSPDLFEVSAILGEARCVSRLRQII